jgi:hypothetical protein
MEKDKKKILGLSRRKFLPFLSAGFFLPFFGSASVVEDLVEEEEEGYKTLLTKDGKAVRVKTKVVKESKTVNKKLSNESLLGWLKKNDENL